MKPKFRISFAAVVLAGLILTACTKKKDTFDSDSGTSYSTVDNLFKDVNKTLNDAAKENNLTGKTDGTDGANDLCATVTLNPPDWTTFPKTVTVDFGTGCTDQYGVTRKGKFTAVFTDYLHNAGAHVSVTFDNYYVNGVKLEGLYALANTSPNSSTRTFNDTITNGKATTPDGKVCTWNATRSSVQTGGFGTLIILDDEYTGQGKSTGIGFNGKTFDATSTNVVMKLNCRYLVSGLVTIYSGTDPTPVKVDFGNGACDNKYKVSYDVYSATLQFWY
ncbi:MAG: hypothetical protein KIS94_15150 [Chitinophagales bacterium]|nr:hypothetical protein [Chitinophagales bacterium]